MLWGATHIVLIEASPHERAGRENFLQNATASLDHLYDQAQLSLAYLEAARAFVRRGGAGRRVRRGRQRGSRMDS